MLCRLSPCPPLTQAPNRYKLGTYNHLFVLGDGFAGQKQTRANFLKRYKGYLLRVVSLNQSVAADITRPEADYGPEYYVAVVSDAPISKGVGKKLEESKKTTTKKGKASKLTQRRAQSIASLEQGPKGPGTTKKDSNSDKNSKSESDRKSRGRY